MVLDLEDQLRQDEYVGPLLACPDLHAHFVNAFSVEVDFAILTVLEDKVCEVV